MSGPPAASPEAAARAADVAASPSLIKTFSLGSGVASADSARVADSASRRASTTAGGLSADSFAFETPSPSTPPDDGAFETLRESSGGAAAAAVVVVAARSRSRSAVASAAAAESEDRTTPAAAATPFSAAPFAEVFPAVAPEPPSSASPAIPSMPPAVAAAFDAARSPLVADAAPGGASVASTAAVAARRPSESAPSPSAGRRFAAVFSAMRASADASSEAAASDVGADEDEGDAEPGAGAGGDAAEALGAGVSAAAGAA